MVGGIVSIALAIAGALYLHLHAGSGFLKGRKPGHSIVWRAQLYARKAQGGVPDLSWGELLQMTRVEGGFGLESIVREGRGANGSVQNPYITDEDREIGRGIFAVRCAGCHSADGGGFHGPPLNRPGLKHGDSDLAIYKVLRDGIPGTDMLAPEISFLERWQLVGFVKSLQAHRLVDQSSEANIPKISVSAERVRSAGSRTDEWITYSGSIDGHRYSPLSEITPQNVSRLRVRWISQFDTPERTIESTPLVVGGVIFITEPPSNAVAIEAKTGKVLWRYFRAVPDDVPLCCGRMNRGLAILGNTLFLGTIDGYLVALNANTGSVVWETQVASNSDGYSITVAPLVVNNSVVVGVAGGEYGIRGFLAAYDPVSGKQQWLFHTIPGPGEIGHQTWENDAWKTGGGPTWVTGSYDPALDLIYWGVGNPAPDFNGDVRPGDNLFTASVIALKASSGKLAWYFQFIPHDEHDWDSNQTPILADVLINGVERKVICWANRNGFYYVLDRATGEFLVGTPFVEQNWAKGLDRAGRPILASEGEASSIGRLVKPSMAGGTNWQNPAFDAAKGLIFVPATEGSSVFTKATEVHRGDRGVYLGSAGSMPVPPVPVVRALDVGTGTKRWERFSPSLKEGYSFSGLLATGGGLVFGAAGGYAFALDSTSGEEKWRVYLGGDTRAAPISFEIDGHQVVAISAGRALFLFEL